LAEVALEHFGALYDIEREVKDLTPGERKTLRQIKINPMADAFHTSILVPLSAQNSLSRDLPAEGVGRTATVRLEEFQIPELTGRMSREIE
jgi:hypothetical protein